MSLTLLNPKLSVAFLTIDVSTNSMTPASKDWRNSSLSPNHLSMPNQLSSNLYMHIFLSCIVSWTWETQCPSSSTRSQKSKQASIQTISASTIPSIISRRSNKSFKFLMIKSKGWSQETTSWVKRLKWLKYLTCEHSIYSIASKNMDKR